MTMEMAAERRNKTSAERVAAYRERLKKTELRRIEVLVHGVDAEVVKEFAAAMRDVHTDKDADALARKVRAAVYAALKGKS